MQECTNVNRAVRRRAKPASRAAAGSRYSITREPLQGLILLITMRVWSVTDTRYSRKIRYKEGE